MIGIIPNEAAGSEPQTEEITEFSEEKVKPKREPRKWDEGFTMVENKILSQGRFLTADAKVAYMALKSFQNTETGLCFPSYDKIIERSGLTRPRLADALGELERFSWLTLKKRFSGSTHYKFHTPFVYLPDKNNKPIELFHDQTCPSKERAKEWSQRLRIKKRRHGKGWKETVNAEKRKFIDNEYEYDDSIPF